MSLPTPGRPLESQISSNTMSNGPGGTMTTAQLNQIYSLNVGSKRISTSTRQALLPSTIDCFLTLLKKADLRRLLWPLFVYGFLELVLQYYGDESRRFFEAFKSDFDIEHEHDLRELEPIGLPEHVEQKHIAKLYRSSRYRVTLSGMAFYNLMQFLESNETKGGAVIANLIQTFMNVVTIDRVAHDQQTIAKLLGRAQTIEDYPAEDEGIPGHNPGSANLESTRATVLTKLKLGQLPMEAELINDVRDELAEQDAAHPPMEGQRPLLSEFDQMIKREEGEDYPTTLELPLPPSKARDVALEVQKVKENRDRFRIESQTGGVGVSVSICMFTFHSTYDSIICLDFSGDSRMVAAGTDSSYIRIWSLDGQSLPGKTSTSIPQASSKRLIGHSAPVYGVSFSPAIESPDLSGPSTGPRFLLSCSGDKSIRLWSLETWTCLVVYKGHDGTIWDITWGPFGHYFLSGSADRTARLWTVSEPAYQRLFVGHDHDVDVVAFHPNSAYVFTGSSDKLVRMWAVSNGYPVRLFTGHTGNLTSLACSPSGKILASADDMGIIILWDLAPGKLLKRMRGHAKAGIWSLSWNVESTHLISGAMDGTVRIWDTLEIPSAPGQGQMVGDSAKQVSGGAVASSSKKKRSKKEVIVSPDQLAAYPTKKSPVYKVHFTRMNLAIAGGAYLP
ncbi:Transcription initiation factor TFIID subunit 5 [Agyrium rufum]|nr:Transcription initiation factor TFIID subunit 5 [Agyrium rufum]